MPFARRAGRTLRCRARWISVVGAGLIALCGTFAVAEDVARPDEAHLLRFGERPLRGDDFRAPVPEDRPQTTPRIEAYSHTLVQYHYKIRSQRRGNRFIAEATDFEVYAVFDPAKSWNAQPEDATLLDHHEGHFTLTAIAAQQIHQELAARRRKRRAIAGQGTSAAAATADLESQVAKLIKGHTESLQREHDYFDQVTRYGTLADVEAREREKQKELLRRTTQPR